MNLKLALAALVLAALPGLAQAMCLDGHKATTSACAEGQSWDAESQTCVDTTA